MIFKVKPAFEAWPEADRTLWSALTLRGGPLDDAGAPAVGRAQLALVDRHQFSQIGVALCDERREALIAFGQLDWLPRAARLLVELPLPRVGVH